MKLIEKIKGLRFLPREVSSWEEFLNVVKGKKVTVEIEIFRNRLETASSSKKGIFAIYTISVLFRTHVDKQCFIFRQSFSQHIHKKLFPSPSPEEERERKALEKSIIRDKIKELKEIGVDVQLISDDWREQYINLLYGPTSNPLNSF